MVSYDATPSASVRYLSRATALHRAINPGDNGEAKLHKSRFHIHDKGVIRKSMRCQSYGNCGLLLLLPVSGSRGVAKFSIPFHLGYPATQIC